MSPALAAPGPGSSPLNLAPGPAEFVLLGYPVLDSPPLPGDEASDEAGDDPGAGPEG